MARSEKQGVEDLLALYEEGVLISQKEAHYSYIEHLLKMYECLKIYENGELCGSIFYFYPDESTVIIVEVFLLSENKMLYLSKVIGIVRNRKKIIFKVKNTNKRMLRFCTKIKCSMQYPGDGWCYCIIER